MSPMGRCSGSACRGLKLRLAQGRFCSGGSPAAAGCRRPSRMARWLRPTDAGVLDGQLVPGVLPLHLQGKAGGRALERHRRAAIDTNGLTPVAQLAGVVSRAGHIQIGATALSILVAGKADRQVAGVQRSGSLRGIDQKGKAGEIVGYGEPVPAAGQLQRTKSVVLQPLNLGALRRVVVGLSLGGVPLLQIMQRFGHFILWKVRVGQEYSPTPTASTANNKTAQGSAQLSQVRSCSVMTSTRLWQGCGAMAIRCRRFCGDR